MWSVIGLAGGQIRGGGTLTRIPFVNTMAQFAMARMEPHNSIRVEGKPNEGK